MTTQTFQVSIRGDKHPAKTYTVEPKFPASGEALALQAFIAEHGIKRYAPGMSAARYFGRFTVAAAQA